jgi:F0F1-type ATP synthase assembly protein I
MAIITILGLGAGFEADRRLDTTPVLSLVGLIGGFVLGMVAMVRGLSNMAAPDDDDRPDDS